MVFHNSGCSYKEWGCDCEEGRRRALKEEYSNNRELREKNMELKSEVEKLKKKVKRLQSKLEKP